MNGVARPALSACLRTAVAAASLLLGTQTRGAWPTYHGGRDLAGVSDTSFDAPAKLTRLWRVKVGSGVSATPVADGQRVFFVNEDGQVGALDAEGTKLWLFTPPPPSDTNTVAKRPSFAAPPLRIGDLVVAGSTAGTVHALDAATGGARWQARGGKAILGSATWTDGGGDPAFAIVVLSQPDGTLRSLDPRSGAVRWTSAPVNRADGSPAADGSRVAFGHCGAALHVVSSTSGVTLLDVPLGDDCQVAGGVALAGGNAYAGSRAGKVFAADLATGRVLWSSAAAAAEIFATPAVDATHVVVAANDRRVYALDRRDGRVTWKADVGGAPGSPAIAGRHVVATGDGAVRLLRLADGVAVWSNAVSDDVTSPAVAGGRIYVGTGEGDIVAFGVKP